MFQNEFFSNLHESNILFPFLRYEMLHLSISCALLKSQ